MPDHQVRLTTDAGEELYPYRDSSEVNRLIVKAIHEGRNIHEVRQVTPTLEDAYFHFVGKNGSGKVERREIYELVKN